MERFERYWTSLDSTTFLERADKYLMTVTKRDADGEERDVLTPSPRPEWMQPAWGAAPRQGARRQSQVPFFMERPLQIQRRQRRRQGNQRDDSSEEWEPNEVIELSSDSDD